MERVTEKKCNPDRELDIALLLLPQKNIHISVKMDLF